MIAKTDYQRTDAQALVRYIEKDRDSDRDVTLKGQHGQPLTSEERQRFIERSAAFEMERHFILAPDPDARYAPATIDRRTRKVMNDWTRDRPSTDYVYAVHDTERHPHAHVAVTGRERDLRMDKTDLRDFRMKATYEFQERQRLPSERTRTSDKDQEHSRGRSPASEQRCETPAAESPDEEQTRDWQADAADDQSADNQQPPWRDQTAESTAEPDQEPIEVAGAARIDSSLIESDLDTDNREWHPDRDRQTAQPAGPHKAPQRLPFLNQLNEHQQDREQEWSDEPDDEREREHGGF